MARLPKSQRKHASKRVIERKERKAKREALIRDTNRSIKKANARLNALKRGGYSTPAMDSIGSNKLKRASSNMSYNQIKHLQGVSSRFNRSKTSTITGAKKYYERITGLLPDAINGMKTGKKRNRFIGQYFDIVDNAKDMFLSAKIYVSSDEVAEIVKGTVEDYTNKALVISGDGIPTTFELDTGEIMGHIADIIRDEYM